MMRKAPESEKIDNPLMAQRMNPSSSKQEYKVPQDITRENKHKRQLEEVKKAQASNNAGGSKQGSSTNLRKDSYER